MNRVCFISVYFGKIPPFFRTFIDSCTWNKDFDWLIVCDSTIPYAVPQNIHVVSMDIAGFKEKVKEKTNLEVGNIKPYKVCDFRPAFGELFENYLDGYEFWGTVDTDLILGNVSQFVTDDILDRYDKIFTMGHMSLVRNTLELNALYKKDTPNSRNFKKVFLNPISCVFDEYEGGTEKFIDEGYKVYKEKTCADVHRISGRLEVTDKFLFQLTQPRSSFIRYCTDKNYKYEVFILDQGRIFKLYIQNGALNRQEYSYIHKLEFESVNQITEKSRLLITTEGLVEDNGFFSKLDNDALVPKDMEKYNKQKLYRKISRYIYLYIRLNIRYFRKKYFPRKYEM